ncbi:MAG: DUF2851 family protein [Bacteroidota bacterium]
MKEDLLHYVWRLQRFDHSDLITTEGQSINIQHVGILNQHAGPDFTDARIQIGDTLWAGNVEMHLKASDWTTHQHQSDKAYENVILHVVLNEDEKINRQDGSRIPCLELKKRIPNKLSKIYKKLLHNEQWIPCQHHFYKVGQMTKVLWLDRLLVERLERKTMTIENLLKENTYNWEMTLYQVLARNFGVKVNAEPFGRLARSLPLAILGKHKSNLFQIEALFFGQAGLLEDDFEDDYPNRLKREYHFLQKKYQLHPIEKMSWRFLRMRPANFPTIRIAQFAQLIFQSVHLFSKMLAAQNVKEIEQMFELRLSNYWQTHYIFDKASPKRNKSLGKNTIHLFIINTIAPFLFLYGKSKANEDYQDKAFQLLEALHPEKNNIITKWKELGITPESAYQSQALLQLKNEYCAKKKCLECSIGNAILR